ncbi:MAG: glycosyltransferase, partial [Desulfofundulus sp.]
HARNIKEDDQVLAEFVLDEVAVDNFWAAFKQLVQEKDVRQKLAAAARRYAEQHNSLATMGDAYEQLIMDLVSRNVLKRKYQKKAAGFRSARPSYFAGGLLKKGKTNEQEHLSPIDIPSEGEISRLGISITDAAMS